jgi:hypothetical protein
MMIQGVVLWFTDARSAARKLHRQHNELAGTPAGGKGSEHDVVGSCQALLHTIDSPQKHLLQCIGKKADAG